MAYIVIKTIKGRQYRYQQRSFRQGGRVRTETIYLGPVDGSRRRKGVARRVIDFIDANRTQRHGLPDDETMLRRYNERVKRDLLTRERTIEKLYDLYGLKVTDTPRLMASEHDGKGAAESREPEADMLISALAGPQGTT